MQLKQKVSLYHSPGKLPSARRCSGVTCLLPQKSSSRGQSLQNPEYHLWCQGNKAFCVCVVVSLMWFGSRSAKPNSSDLWKVRGHWESKVWNKQTQEEKQFAIHSVFLLLPCYCVVGGVWLLPPNGPQLTWLLCPWKFPGKNTGVGCHSLLQFFPCIWNSND